MSNPMRPATLLNQAVADAALLNRTLPLGLLRSFVQTGFSEKDGLTPELMARLKTLARTPHLLVACNYGGTLCVAEGSSTETLPANSSAAVALRGLAALPDTDTAIISGRSLRDLASVSRMPAEVTLVGCYGAEVDMAYAQSLDLATEVKLQQAGNALAETVGAEPGVTIERKPVAVAVHTHASPPEIFARVARETRAVAAEHGLHYVRDRSVLDLTVFKPAKDDAVEALRQQFGASAVLYAGDAGSDESAIRALQGVDLGLWVGNGKTSATHRLRNPDAFARVLAILFEMRRAWLFGEDVVGLERHSLLGDGSSTALVTPDAKIGWLTHPMPDSGSIFAHILGGDAAGHFSVEPARPSTVLGQRYVSNTMVVETRWADVTVTDYLEPSPEGVTQLVRVLSGTGQARVTFAPRPDYANAPFDMDVIDGGVHVVGTADPIMLYGRDVEWDVTSDGRHATATAVVDLSAGPVVLTLRCGETEPCAPDPEGEPERRAKVLERDRIWVRGLNIPVLERSLVARSALVLRAMVHEPTGGVLAAPTTSLPEGIGGVRNWDYRFCWLRDGSMTVRALLAMGSTVEAQGFLDWLVRILAASPGPEWLHPLYAVSGAPLSSEATLENLPGYAGSRPVRIGNAADHQVQLDVFGPIAELIHDLAAATGELTDVHWALLQSMAAAVSSRWDEPDNGIWEARITPRHHVYTKTMCWTTLDRAIRTARRYGRTPDPDWAPLAATIRHEVLEQGWSDVASSYTVAYGSDDVDAAVLHIGLSGLLGANDPRFQATVAAVERDLRVGPTVFRYRYDDGLPGLEGGFHICTTWLIEAYLMVGRFDDAEKLFSQLVGLVGPTGLLPEEYDPMTETHLGNHPQAYSHLGLIRCAQLLDTRLP